jgi:hypothetical protein
MLSHKKFEIEPFRQLDSMFMKICMEFDVSKYDSAIVAFYCGGKQLEIITTLSGSIKDNCINIKTNKMEAIIEYADSSPILECITSFLVDGKEIFQDLQTGSFDNSLKINLDKTKPRIITTVNYAYEAKMQEFIQYLAHPKSKWKVMLQLGDNIILDIQSCDDQDVMVCLGEQSLTLLQRDQLFKLYPSVKKMTIPLNSFQGENVGVFELVSPDFLDSSNLFYKIPISNFLQVRNPY